MVESLKGLKRPSKLISFIVGLLLLAAGTIVASNPFTQYFPKYAARYGISLAYTQLRITTSIYLFQPRHYLTDYLAFAAIETGNTRDAETYAYALLNVAERNSSDRCFYGGAVHDAHTIFGRLSLKRGDFNEAIKQLLLSAETPGSPSLDSFGPNLSLADEMLIAGEKDAVIEYLEKTSRFWDMQDTWLPDWKHEIQTVGMLNISDFHRLSPS